MSHLWPELLRITVCPDQVVLERGRLVISLKGVEPQYLAPEIVPVEPRHDPALWSAPLAVLEILLDGLPPAPYDANVILSNHFVHYPLVQADMPGQSDTTAGVIEQELQVALTEMLDWHDCRLTSLQPRIVDLGTNLVDELQGEPGWLVVVEEGLACLGLIQDWEFTRLRNLYMWPASSVELLPLLDREARQAGLPKPPRNLILWQRDESDEVALPNNLHWHITYLGKRMEKPIHHQTFPWQFVMPAARA